jgi:hypothetical protein
MSRPKSNLASWASTRKGHLGEADQAAQSQRGPRLVTLCRPNALAPQFRSDLDEARRPAGEINGAGSRGRGAHVRPSRALCAYSRCFCAASGPRSTRRQLPSSGWRRPPQRPAPDCSALRLAEARARERRRRRLRQRLRCVLSFPLVVCRRRRRQACPIPFIRPSSGSAH